MATLRCRGGIVSAIAPSSASSAVQGGSGDDGGAAESSVVFSVARWRRGAAALTADELLAADELVVERERVVWRTLGARAPKRSYRIDFRVMQAVVCTFPAMYSAAGAAGPPPLCVCLLRADDIITIYAADGRLFDVKQPCRIARIWAMESGAAGCVGGLMLQRDLATGTDGGVLFSLTHPLEEVRPLAFVVDGSAEAAHEDFDCRTNYFCDARDVVVWVDDGGDSSSSGAVPHWPAIATYHSELQRVALWRVERLPLVGDAWNAPALASDFCMRLVAAEPARSTPTPPAALFTVSGDETHRGRLLCVTAGHPSAGGIRVRALHVPSALDAAGRAAAEVGAPPSVLRCACVYDDVVAAAPVQTSREDTLGTGSSGGGARLLLTVTGEGTLRLFRASHRFAVR